MNAKIDSFLESLDRISRSFEKLVDFTISQEPAAKSTAKATTTTATTKVTKPTTETKEKAEVDETIPTLEEVVKALQGFMTANGKDKAVELLGEFDAKKASDIAEARRGEFIKAAQSEA